MAGDIGIPFVFQLKDGVDTMHLTDLEEITEAIENGHLFQYITDDSQTVEEAAHEMYLTQPITQIIDNNVQIINNGVQILEETNPLMESNLQIGMDNRLDVQLVTSNTPILNDQQIDNVQIVNNSYQIIENGSGPMEILTSNGQIVNNEGHIIENIHILDKNVRILNKKNQKIYKNSKKLDNNVINNLKMETDVNDTETKGVVNFIYEVVYPEQLNLKFKGLKRGRPKKIKVEEPEPVKPAKILKPAPKTRSGRVVRLPKHIEKDFKKIEFEETTKENGEAEIKAVDFEQYQEEPPKRSEEKFEQDLKAKRIIASQYRCPKCQRAYLGKAKMIKHIKKYPDHGPIPLPRNENNFDVWNYLVDITQKSPPAQRGLKFCGELTNLLHNILLLTSALFKEVDENKTFVEVDKVLGNAIGLQPGQYKFNDSELYKDVTILKLISNTDFFKPVTISKETMNENITKEIKDEKTEEVSRKNNTSELEDERKVTENNETKNKCDIGDRTSDVNEEMICFDSVLEKNTKENESLEHESVSVPNTKPVENVNEEPATDVSNIQHFNKKSPSTPLDDRISVHQELLSENSLLHMPNLRSAVDDLILPPVDSGSSLLDNSTSSDEVINVDQFVNERFKKITEPDLDMSNGSLNLDLPPLDLFQFHTS